MTTYIVMQAMKMAHEASRHGDIRPAIEAAIIKAAKQHGAVFYDEVGPTGAWNVFGDCYDWGEVNPTVTIEVSI